MTLWGNFDAPYLKLLNDASVASACFYVRTCRRVRNSKKIATIRDFHLPGSFLCLSTRLFGPWSVSKYMETYRGNDAYLAPVQLFLNSVWPFMARKEIYLRTPCLDTDSSSLRLGILKLCEIVFFYIVWLCIFDNHYECNMIFSVYKKLQKLLMVVCALYVISCFKGVLHLLPQKLQN